MQSHSIHRLSMMLKSGMVAAATAALSLVAIPLPVSPVPVTGQSLGVMLSGLLLGPWWGALSMVVYLTSGILGLPVFANGGSGLGAIAGPTGGYLLSFVVGTAVTGALASVPRPDDRLVLGRSRQTPGFLRLVAASFVGCILIVHLAGTAWLAWQIKRTFAEALSLGSIPFLPGDILKVIVASFVAERYHKIAR